MNIPNPLPPAGERAKLNFTKERARDLLDCEDDAYRIIRDEIVDHGRWTVSHELIIQSVADNRFYRGYYSVGATESQDESPWEYDNPVFTEVFPAERVVIDYR